MKKIKRKVAANGKIYHTESWPRISLDVTTGWYVDITDNEHTLCFYAPRLELNEAVKFVVDQFDFKVKEITKQRVCKL